MVKCTEPGLIREGDLIAYVDGEADEKVRSHVDQCSFCNQRVAELRKTSLSLFATMFRFTCPPVEILRQYREGESSAGEKLQISAHVRSCTHCARELTIMTEEPDSLVTLIFKTIQNVTKVIEAQVTVHRRNQLVGVRGRGRPIQRSYRTDDLDIVVGLQIADSSQRGKLVGAVKQAKEVAGGRAWLFQEDTEPFSTPVDELGTFVFENVTGKYELALEIGHLAILLREVSDSE